ncbi:MAG: MBL fold metallo-hydrolase, partial [Euryarchaeota archaeon]|nr:MBL fold metallo-hydrolase [Euryarchaeota archaeon]
MKVLNLTSDSKMYTSNVYLITGTWNAIDDLNTLVDVGRDPSVIEKINNASTGVGKKRVEQVVLTHSHYD